VTVTALEQEQVDVALLFTTDPHIASGDFILLECYRRARLSTTRAAFHPHIPCMPPPGGVDEEQR